MGPTWVLAAPDGPHVGPMNFVIWALLIVHKFQSLPQSHVYIRNDSHQINQCEYEFENANYDVGHTNGINWKGNNWYHFHFYFNYHLMYMYFQLKKTQLESLKYQLSAWLMICISFNGLPQHIIKMAINHIEMILSISMCIKIACI